MQVIVDRQRGATWDESRSSRTCRLQVVLSSYSVESTQTDDVFTASRKYFDERQVLAVTKEEMGGRRKNVVRSSATGLLLVKLGLVETPAPSPKGGSQASGSSSRMALPQPQRWPFTLHNPTPLPSVSLLSLLLSLPKDPSTVSHFVTSHR